KVREQHLDGLRWPALGEQPGGRGDQVGLDAALDLVEAALGSARGFEVAAADGFAERPQRRRADHDQFLAGVLAGLEALAAEVADQGLDVLAYLFAGRPLAEEVDQRRSIGFEAG